MVRKVKIWKQKNEQTYYQLNQINQIRCTQEANPQDCINVPTKFFSNIEHRIMKMNTMFDNFEHFIGRENVGGRERSNSILQNEEH